MNINKNLQELCYQTGYRILENQGMLILGMSPGNSYFKKQIIHELLTFTATLSPNIKVFIPSKPAEHTYKALGLPIEKAERSARLKSNAIKNHCASAITQLPAPQNIQILDWEAEIENSIYYQQQLQHLQNLYSKPDSDGNHLFRGETRTACRQVIQRDIKPGVDMEQAIDEAAHYIIKEFAFILASPKILGINEVAFIYHKPWPQFEKLMAGAYDSIVRNNIGFIVISMAPNL